MINHVRLFHLSLGWKMLTQKYIEYKTFKVYTLLLCKIVEGFGDVLCFGKQDTGKLRIGTYTGDLEHGTVYSGGGFISYFSTFSIFKA